LRGPTADIRVRRALSYAFDYATAVDQLRKGQAVPLQGPINSANPAHHPCGDFVLNDLGKVVETTGELQRLTFAGIGIYRPELFQGIAESQPAPLAPLLISAMREGRVTGEHYRGEWLDIGTPERLQELDRKLKEVKT